MAALQRLDKILSNLVTDSRSKVKELIKKGRVTVDNKIVRDPGFKINPEINNLTIEGLEIIYKKYFYYMLNKPADVLSAVTDDKYKTVIDLLELNDRKKGLFPVGRLDIDTEGLIILSNNGQLAHSLLSPKRHVEKEYIADIIGDLNEDTIEFFEKGIRINDDFVCKPAILKINYKTENVYNVTIIITEGKFHQIKRMFEAVNSKVIFLKRVRMAEIKLDNTLLLGQYRELTQKEIDLLEAHK